LQIDQELTKL